MAEKDSKKRFSKFKKEKPEFEQQIVDIARVTRVMAGGKRMRFRICLVIGDRKGRVGMGLAKGKDVPLAVQKAYHEAENNMIKINLINGTIPHEIYLKQGASKILLKPAPKGTGVIAGGACRIVLSIAGVENIVAKIMGGSNQVNNVKTTLAALKLLKTPRVRTEKNKASKESKEVKKDDSKEKLETKSVKTEENNKPL